MTLTEKILARAAGKSRVQAGDNIWAKADILMTHDVAVLEQLGFSKGNLVKMPKFGTRIK